MSAAAERVDCVVIGAGPAGLSAALWLTDHGLSFVLLERGNRVGGEVPRINLPIQNYLGCRARDGHELLTDFERTIDSAQLSLRLGCGVRSIVAADKSVLTDNGEVLGRTLILAMGLRRRKLDVPGAERYRGCGVSYSATTDLARLAGGPVAVVGGGDGALENALILADSCPEVHLLHRRPAFDARPQFVERVAAHPHIRSWLDTRVVALGGDDERLEQAEVDTPSGRRSIDVPWLVVKIGFVPNTDAIGEDSVQLDEEGYVVVDRYLHTSTEGVFAAGDVCNPRSPCIAAAVGDGAVAAREVSRYLQDAPRGS